MMPSRREFLGMMGAAVLAQPSAPAALPLQNLGLEHLDIIVPDPAASARFYARIFKTNLHQQPVRDTLRYFVLLGDLPADRQVGYIAIGAGQGRPPSRRVCVSSEPTSFRRPTNRTCSGSQTTTASLWSFVLDAARLLTTQEPNDAINNHRCNNGRECDESAHWLLCHLCASPLRALTRPDPFRPASTRTDS